MRALILLIGDELLNGLKADSNGRFLSARCLEIGIEVQEIRMVPDRIEAVVKALNDFVGRAELVFISGGLGPTVDDITRDALAEFFDSSTREYYLPAVQRIKQYKQQKYATEQLSALDLRQAEVLKVATKIFDNQVGGAPSMAFQKDDMFWVSLPGVPIEFKNIVETQLIPYLQQNYNLSQGNFSKYLVVDGISEADLSDLVDPIYQQTTSEISWAYLPDSSLTLLRLSTQKQALKAEMEQIYESLKNLLNNYVVAEDKVDFWRYCKQYLRENKLKISLAESCTGGALAAVLTAEPGASDFFAYSAVVYNNDMKKVCLKLELGEEDVVSEVVVQKMLYGVLAKSGSDLAIAVSGYLNLPEDSVRKREVWIAIGTKAKKQNYREVLAFNDRSANREYILQRIGYRLYGFLRNL